MIRSRNSIVTCLALFTVFAIAADPALAAQKSSREARTWLARQVRHELVMLPYYGVFDNLEFKAEDSKVTLLGQVTRPTLKADAERAVKTIEGVEEVDNRIEVLPVSPNDDRLRIELYRTIYSQAALQKYAHRAVPPIHIIVKNGHVTLEGVVLDEGDRNTANIAAKGVPGVFSVNNNLRTEKPKS